MRNSNKFILIGIFGLTFTMYVFWSNIEWLRFLAGWYGIAVLYLGYVILNDLETSPINNYANKEKKDER